MAAAGEIDLGQLSASQQEALQQYTQVTNQEIQDAVPLLRRSEWNVQVIPPSYSTSPAPTDVPSPDRYREILRRRRARSSSRSDRGRQPHPGYDGIRELARKSICAESSGTRPKGPPIRACASNRSSVTGVASASTPHCPPPGAVQYRKQAGFVHVSHCALSTLLSSTFNPPSCCHRKNVAGIPKCDRSEDAYAPRHSMEVQARV
jgi:hypothetical protein